MNTKRKRKKLCIRHVEFSSEVLKELGCLDQLTWLRNVKNYLYLEEHFKVILYVKI